MKKLFLLLIGFVFLNTVVAQKSNQLCGSAYSILIQPGTIPVDENGVVIKPKINKERFIYLMVPGKNKPLIKSVQYNKTLVKWDILSEAEPSYSVISEHTQKTLKIKPFKSGTMWRVNIQEYPHRSIPTNALPIVIKGNLSNKPFSIIVNKETAVQGYDSY